MKITVICLFACVAVSHAAFSANLVQRAQPSVAQAMFRVRLATMRSEPRPLQAALIAELQEQVNIILNQIQNGVDLTLAAAASLQSQLAEAQSQIASLASVVGSNLSATVSNLLNSVNSIWSNIFGQGNKRFGILHNLNGAELEEIKEWLNSYVEQLNLSTLIQNTLNALLTQIGLGQVGLENRGIWENFWGSITDATTSAWNQITSISTDIFNLATGAFTDVQQLAFDFVNSAIDEVSTISAQAASDFLEFLRPFQEDLGTLWNEVETQVSLIIGAGGGASISRIM